MSCEPSCGFLGGSFIPFLAAHPAFHRLLTQIFRTHAVDRLVGLAARTTLERYRGSRTIDYDALIERHACPEKTPEQLFHEDMDTRFFLEFWEPPMVARRRLRASKTWKPSTSRSG